MCAGSIYWSNIGTLVFASTEEKLLQLTGDDSENMTLNLSCREVFEKGQKDVRIFGPFEEVEEDVGSPPPRPAVPVSAPRLEIRSGQLRGNGV